MPNSPAHMAIGAATGLVVALVPTDENKTTLDPFLGAGVGTFFGKLPDILEPALNPHHRQFFHSILVAGSIAYGLKKAYHWHPENETEKLFRGLALVAGGAYLSHLIFDGATPMSLPLIGKV